MKKITVILLLLAATFMSVNAQSSLKKITVIDRAWNPVRHWRIYSFEMSDRVPVDMSKLKKSLSEIKGVQKAEAAPQSARVLIYVNEDMILGKSNELKNAFTTNGFDLVNIPVENK